MYALMMMVNPLEQQVVPILATIEGNDLTNVIVMVNRWYGGVKLGTGGLVRAYGGCAGQCLLLAEKLS